MSTFLSDFKQEISKRKNSNVFFIAEYKDGKLTSEALLETNPCQNIYSVAKTYMVTAIGLLYDRGLVSLDEKITDILADELPHGYNKVWDEIDLHMLLLHQLPLKCGSLDIDCLDATEFGDDYLSYVFKAPFRHGYVLSESTYTDAAYYIASRIIEKRAGMPTDSFLWKYLLYPTRCREAAFSHCPKGFADGMGSCSRRNSATGG